MIFFDDGTAQNRYQQNMTTKKTPPPPLLHLSFWLLALLSLALIVFSVFFKSFRQNLIYLWSRDISIAVVETIDAPVSWLEDSFAQTKMFWQNVDKLGDIQTLEDSALSYQNQAQLLKEENNRLRKQLNFISILPTGSKTSQILSHSGGMGRKNYYIYGGQRHDIHAGDILTSGSYLIGRVDHVGPNYSKVMSIWDHSSRIPVTLMDKKEKAILVGMGHYIKIEFSDETLSPIEVVNQVMVTSGDGLAFPPSILVGIVQHRMDIGFYLDSFIDIDSLEFVNIYNFNQQNQDQDQQRDDGRGHE
jgi:cell shape-determining protein MreC